MINDITKEDAISYLVRAILWLDHKELDPPTECLNCDAMAKAIEALKKAN